jgi:DNA-binding IscR family transcriptional regulator
VNRTERYRVEALIELASVYPESRASADIARSRSIPSAYLSRLLGELVRAGWVVSRRGPGGGVSLAQPPESIPVSAALTESLTSADLPPALSRLARTIDGAIEGSINDITIADLTRWERETEPPVDYTI